MHKIDTCVLTGTGEVLQNTKFLEKLYIIFKKLGHPFPNIELQTTGVMLFDAEHYISGESGQEINVYHNLTLLKKLRVNTISLSISDIFNNENNNHIIGVPDKLKFKLPEMVHSLKMFGFNVRLSLNMLNTLDGIEPERIFKYAKTLGADQISFKRMYYNNELEYAQNDWIRENMCQERTINDIKDYVL
jgi:hypothetical protein